MGGKGSRKKNRVGMGPSASKETSFYFVRVGPTCLRKIYLIRKETIFTGHDITHKLRKERTNTLCNIQKKKRRRKRLFSDAGAGTGPAVSMVFIGKVYY